jgi:hypothetical protein
MMWYDFDIKNPNVQGNRPCAGLCARSGLTAGLGRMRKTLIASLAFHNAPEAERFRP